MDLLAYPNINMSDLNVVWPELTELEPDTVEYLTIDATYAGYLERQARDIEAFRRDEGLRIPDALDYGTIGGLSNEVRTKLIAARPATLGQVGQKRISRIKRLFHVEQCLIFHSGTSFCGSGMRGLTSSRLGK